MKLEHTPGPWDEEWRDVPGWEGIYSVSNTGRVLSHKRYVNHVFGVRVVNERLMNLNVNEDGYKVVCFRSVDRKRKTYKVHRLVGIVFLNVPVDMEINHLDGNKLNNRADNLEICSRVQNQRHAIMTGLSDPTKNNRQLSEEDVYRIIPLIKKGLSMDNVGKMFNVSHQCIRDIKNGVSWKYITTKTWDEINESR